VPADWESIVFSPFQVPSQLIAPPPPPPCVLRIFVCELFNFFRKTFVRRPTQEFYNFF
jgi:hypothetical protein